MVLTIKPAARDNTRRDNSIKDVRAEQNVKLTINIPKSLRAKFKIAAIHNDTDMSEMVLNWIEEYINRQ